MSDIRRDYGQLSLSGANAKDCPIAQFESWFADVVKTEKSDPTAMVLSTVDERGDPDSRVVLLKGIHRGAFVFYTNYQSAKAEQIRHHPAVALHTRVASTPVTGRAAHVQVERIAVRRVDAGDDVVK